MQFAYALLTRSQRVSHENLRLRDRTWLEGMEQWFAERASGHPVQLAVPPMFTPFRLRGLELANRIAVSPMAMYSAKDGVRRRLPSGAPGRPRPGRRRPRVHRDDLRRPGRAHHAGLRRHVRRRRTSRPGRGSSISCTRHSEAKICLQLGHAGPKGSTRLGWEGMDEPLETGNWPLIGPSAVPWSPAHQVPRPMTRADMDDVLAAFVRATGDGASAAAST